MNLIKSLHGQKMLTISLAHDSQVFDVSASGVVGYEKEHEQMLASRLSTALKDSGSLVVRQFLPFEAYKNENGISIPFKNLYGVFLGNNDIIGITKEELKIAFETDSNSGKKIEKEKGIYYCELKL